MFSSSQLLSTLSRHWGYNSFRPGQEEIALSIAEGRDACVVMPTGGGKSLCYQLPAALANERTAIVISPLIALMQDQVAQLEEMGIPAAVLNSSLSPGQREKVLRDAQNGKFRLLYLSPESVAQKPVLQWLKSLPLSFFVIDEAHCISEWGHDFRPEYRQLNRLRREFPDLPIAAFTASATQRVRHDIVELLALREPLKYIASFYRSNLRFLVRECSRPEQEAILLDSLRALAEGSAIVYASTIRRVEETMELLKSNDIDCIGYHGQMENSQRRHNLRLWSSDKVRILVGTKAFGLGINKANVRKVIHLALPKSVEQYYQEAGRAGRDEEPADCLLLWQKRDAATIAHFVSQIGEEQEREHAWQRYHEIREFVDNTACRHLTLCRHFGERLKWLSCNNCDVCSPSTRQPVMARPSAIIKEIVAGKEKRAAGKEVQVRVQTENQDLWEALREWRRTAAQQNAVPAFVILHDSILGELCEKKPGTKAEVRTIRGFGERKTELYASSILEIIKRFRTVAV